MAKLKRVESTASVTLPTVTYGSMLVSVKTVVETDEDQSLEDLHREVREATDNELQAHKAAYDDTQAEFFKLKQNLR